jgi:hypothetical protein
VCMEREDPSLYLWMHKFSILIHRWIARGRSRRCDSTRSSTGSIKGPHTIGGSSRYLRGPFGTLAGWTVRSFRSWSGVRSCGSNPPFDTVRAALFPDARLSRTRSNEWREPVSNDGGPGLVRLLDPADRSSQDHLLQKPLEPGIDADPGPILASDEGRDVLAGGSVRGQRRLVAVIDRRQDQEVPFTSEDLWTGPNRACEGLDLHWG